MSAPDAVERTLAAWIVRSSSAKTLARLEATIAPLPTDRKVGEALVAFVENPPFQARSTKPLWEAVLALLPRHVDAELVARLSALRGRSVERLGAKAMGAWIDRALEAAWPAIDAAGRARPAPKSRRRRGALARRLRCAR